MREGGKRGGGERGERRGGGRGRKGAGEGADAEKEGSKGSGSVLEGPPAHSALSSRTVELRVFPRRQTLPETQLGKDPPVGSLHFLTLLLLGSQTFYAR